MTDHYDALETRDPALRETALFDALSRHLGRPADRAALAALPVLRKAELAVLQAEYAPFGGLTTLPPGRLRRLLVSPGPIFEPEGAGADWWGAARALFAAGVRAGDVVHNSFSYHLTPGGFIMESGATALGCAVVPAGVSPSEQQLEAVAAFRPAAYCGTPDFLKILLDKAEEAGRPAASIRRALVSGAAFPPSLQQHLAARGVEAFQAYATADLGVIAYETEARAGLVVNEGLIVEIVRPGTGEPAPEGEVGELVVTRLTPEYPLVRFGTGDLSKLLPGQSPCGRTNHRLAGWMGRADQRTKVRGMFVDPAQVREIGRRHPELGRLRLVVTRADEQDRMTLRAEAPTQDHALAARVAETVQAQTRLRGAVELVQPGSLPGDGKVIADERPV